MLWHAIVARVCCVVVLKGVITRLCRTHLRTHRTGTKNERRDEHKKNGYIHMEENARQPESVRLFLSVFFSRVYVQFFVSSLCLLVHQKLRRGKSVTRAPRHDKRLPADRSIGGRRRRLVDRSARAKRLNNNI